MTEVDRGSFADSFSYDDNGNMTCRTESGVTYVQTYSAENRTASIQKLASGTCAAPGNLAAKWDFTYDGDGVRTGQSYTPYTDGQPGTVEITRYYFGGAYETKGSTWKKYYSFAGQLVAMRTWDVGLGTWNLSYFLSDHLGSTSVVLDDDGTVLEQQRYLPFGQARVTPPYASVTSTDFTYTGQRNLPDTGLMDYKARFYSPALGRFIQPDSIIPGAASPQSWNRFSYVGNNPTGYADPTGHRRDDGYVGNHGRTNCKDERYEKYCHGDKLKSQKELEKMYNNRKDRRLEELIRQEIDRRFDPFAGWLPAGADYENPEPVNYPNLDLQVEEAYEQAGYDIWEIAANNQDNPMDDEDWKSSGVPLDYIYSKGVGTRKAPGHQFFLNWMGRDINNPSNYEANYLNALMVTHPEMLDLAKEQYYSDLVYSQGSLQAAWDFLHIQVGPKGTMSGIE